MKNVIFVTLLTVLFFSLIGFAGYDKTEGEKENKAIITSQDNGKIEYKNRWSWVLIEKEI